MDSDLKALSAAASLALVELNQLVRRTGAFRSSPRRYDI